MGGKVRSHIKSNVVGYLALLLVLSSPAAATHQGGDNTIDSGDIIDGQVLTPDLGTGAVTFNKVSANAINSARVVNNTLTGDDIANSTLAGVDVTDGSLSGADITNGTVAGIDVADGSLTGADVFDSSLASADVLDNSLTGADVNESTFGQVPSAAAATLGGFGRRSATDAQCDPESTTFEVCVAVSLNLPSATRVLLIGQITGQSEIDANSGFGDCRLGTSVVGLPETLTDIGVGWDHNTPRRLLNETTTMVTVTPVLGPGQVSFGIDCNQATIGAITYSDAGIAAVAISPS